MSSAFDKTHLFGKVTDNYQASSELVLGFNSLSCSKSLIIGFGQLLVIPPPGPYDAVNVNVPNSDEIPTLK